MRAKDYLYQLINYELYLDTLKESYEISYTLATKVTQSISEISVQTSKKNTSERAYIRCAELRETIDKAISDHISLKQEALQLISKLEDNLYKTILVKRYIHRKEWSIIADEIEYSVDWTYKLHHKALEELNLLLNSTVKNS